MRSLTVEDLASRRARHGATHRARGEPDPMPGCWVCGVLREAARGLQPAANPRADVSAGFVTAAELADRSAGAGPRRP